MTPAWRHMSCSATEINLISVVHAHRIVEAERIVRSEARLGEQRLGLLEARVHRHRVEAGARLRRIAWHAGRDEAVGGLFARALYALAQGLAVDGERERRAHADVVERLAHHVELDVLAEDERRQAQLVRHVLAQPVDLLRRKAVGEDVEIAAAHALERGFRILRRIETSPSRS